MDLVIGNKVIITPMEQILHQLQKEIASINGKLQTIGKRNHQNIPVTCPNDEHKGGFERHPSCQVFADPDDEFTEYGKVHCFSCGYSASLPKFVGYCFEEDEKFGEEWLLLRCETAFISDIKYLPEITIDKPKESVQLLDESELKKYQYYHEYMWKRKLSKEIVDRYEVGYDPKQNMLIFPVRDEKSRLRFVTGRSVTSHRFMIPKDTDKPVYLLYDMIRRNVNHVYICEGQIDALYLNSIGLEAVALIGTGSRYQYEILNKSGIRNFTLMLDGDAAGRKGIQRFQSNIRDDVLVNVIYLPEGKDVNDLSKEEIYKLIGINL